MIASALTQLLRPGSPFELHDDGTGYNTSVFRAGPHALGDVYRRALRHGSKPYLISQGGVFTYEALFQRAAAIANHLSTYGVVHSQAVAILMGKTADWLAVFIAVTSIGGRAILLDPSAHGSNIDVLLRLTECRVVVVDDSSLATLRSASASVLNVAEISDRVRPSVGVLEFKGAPEDVAIVALTSGSTGQPKGVMLSHRNLTSGLKNMMLGASLCAMLARGDVPSAIPPAGPPCTLVMAPFFHIAGFSQLLLAMVLGGRIVFSDSVDFNALGELVEREKIRSVSGAPLSTMLDMIRFCPEALSSLSVIGIHGSAAHQHVIEEIKAGLPQVSVATGYGSTETSGSIAVASDKILAKKPRSCGVVLPSVQFAMSRDFGPECDVSELLIRGPMVMRGYCTQNSSNLGVSMDGWLKTGDIGRVDGEGFLFIEGRRNERPGFASSLKDLEEAAMKFEEVDQAAAIWIPSHNVVLLAVESRAHLGGLTERLLAAAAALDAQIAIEVVCEARLPLTSTGKLDKVGISERWREGAARRASRGA